MGRGEDVRLAGDLHPPFEFLDLHETLLVVLEGLLGLEEGGVDGGLLHLLVCAS